MDEPQVPPPPAPGFNWALALIPLVAIGLFLYWMVGRKAAQPDEVVEGSSGAFNVAEVPKEPEPAAPAPSAGGYESQAEREQKERERSAGPGLSGFVPEKDRMFYQDPKAKADEARQRELDFVKKYDPAIQEELGKLNVITRRYYKKEPIVREVDAAFGGLPRYMALRDKYFKDHNPYDFIRGAIALPEVRKTVYKYALSPDVWRVSIGMMTEGLRQKPPPPVYNECKRFMADDTEVAGFVTNLTGYVTPRVGSILPKAIQPGQDLSAVQGLAKELNVGGPTVNLNNAKATVGRAQTAAPPR